MNLGTLPVNINGSLTADRRKVLMDIIEQEFNNKESLYHQVQEREEEKIIEAYRKDIGYYKFATEYAKAERKVKEAAAKVKAIEKSIEALGLDTDGSAASTSNYDHRNNRHIKNYKAIKLQQLLETVKKNAPSLNLKSKLIVRLQLATTIGEGNIIMREVLGNGIIPTINPNQINYKQ